MKRKLHVRKEAIHEFVRELSGFAREAEDALNRIQKGGVSAPDLFASFSDRMFAIRGTAQQLHLYTVAAVSRLGEEIAMKGSQSQAGWQVRRCMGSLWDVLTTVKHMLKNPSKDPRVREFEILVNRLERTLKMMGGARPVMTEDEIEALIAR